VRLPQSFCYLASILDEFSRYCVGWALTAMPVRIDPCVSLWK
jgi:transposase InsO family protein